MARPRLDLRGFRTAVGRRIVGLFVLCALIPTAALAANSYVRVRKALRTEAWQRLDQSSRATGMSLMERLTAAERELELVQWPTLGNPPASRPDHLWRLLGSASVTGPDAGSLFGPPFEPPDLSAAEQSRVTAGETALVVDTSAAPVRLYLAREVPGGGVLWGRISTDSLLGIPAIYASADTRQSFCVLAAGVPLSDCRGLPAQLLEPPPPSRASTPTSAVHAVVKTPDGSLMAAKWELFLRPRFGAASWEVLVATPERTGLAPLAPFRRSFLQILVFALAVVVLLSHREIRRSLLPLERLHESALRLGRHDFGARVKIESRDEFEDVASAFNLMADELGREFAALDMINRMDRTVLTTLDWTRIIDELVGRLSAVMPADGLALLVRSATNHEEAHLECAPAGSPDQKVVLRVRLSPQQSEWLEKLAKRDEGRAEISAGPMPMLDEPLTELLGDLGSRLALPLGRDAAGRGALVLAARDPHAFGREDRVRAHQLADQLTVVLHSVDLFTEREELLSGAMLALGRAIDAKSSWTAGHSERVAALGVAISRQLGLDEEEQQRLYRGALLHDIGKIAVPRSLLDKPSSPTSAEREVLLSHVVVGERILEPIRAFADILPIVRQHHERYDGSGYPDGLRGEEIHLLARVLAVADVFDALVSARPYRTAYTPAAVERILRDGAGTQFDPDVVDAFLRVMPPEPGERSEEVAPGPDAGPAVGESSREEAP